MIDDDVDDGDDDGDDDNDDDIDTDDENVVKRNSLSRKLARRNKKKASRWKTKKGTT